MQTPRAPIPCQKGGITSGETRTISKRDGWMPRMNSHTIAQKPSAPSTVRVSRFHDQSGARTQSLENQNYHEIKSNGSGCTYSSRFKSRRAQFPYQQRRPERDHHVRICTVPSTPVERTHTNIFMWRCPGQQEQNTRQSLRMSWARTYGNAYWSHSVNQPRARPYAPLCQPHPRHPLKPTRARLVDCRTRHARALRPRIYYWLLLAPSKPKRRRGPYNRCF